MMEQQQNETTERARARVGQTLRGKWRLDRLLGVGGMAAVYAATHRNGNLGAVKMLHPELSINTQARSRFAREGYVANKVGHPGAVAVLDDDIAEDGSVFLVMELLEGESLAALAARRAGRLALPEALTIADAVLDVLVAAHEQGIVHRDLKPENLFLTARGELKVLDFGIARLRDAPDGPTTTATGTLLGTPAFLPPEQAQGEWHRVDGRSDLWAVGATLFSLITGRHVHQEPNMMKLMLSAMTRPAPPLATVMPDAPAPLCALIDRALAYDPEDRWPDARAMQRAVRDARAELGYPGASMAVIARSAPGSIITAPTLESDRGSAALAMARGSVRTPAESTSTTAPLSNDPSPAPLAPRSRWRIPALLALGAAWITTAALLAPSLIRSTSVSTAPAATSVPLPELTPTADAPRADAPAVTERVEPASPPSSAPAPAPASASARAAGPRKAAPPEAARPPSPPATAAPAATAAPSATPPPGGNVASAIRDRK